MPPAPEVRLYPLGLYLSAADVAGVRSLALAFTVGCIVSAWEWAARLPWYGARLLTHEWWHATTGAANQHHAPWWTFRVECGHALRFRDPDGLLALSAPWREAWLERG